ncbi:MAG: ferrous iron transport protein B [Crocinitomicaceae bacterium]|nr:ferrous iron transport protein B [Crocinitomicaceae bacterium]MBK8925239.1 ferrous iron transport protein B [Crocinitomicaceae bacterium]
MEIEPAGSTRRVALVGNANIGKTSLFNKLCGLNQKTGNYPGVTIDKKRGKLNAGGDEFEVIDLPGISSLYPNSKDEELVVDYLLNNKSADFPEKIILVVSAVNLKRTLYVFDQVFDLGIPMILAINMHDLAEKRGIKIDADKLSAELKVPVVKISARTEEGIDTLKNLIAQNQNPHYPNDHFIETEYRDLLHQFAKIVHVKNEYRAFLLIAQDDEGHGDEKTNALKKKFIAENDLPARKWKVNESILRYKFINQVIKNCVEANKEKAVDFTTRADKLLLHPVWGYVLFALILFTIFQSVFWLASYPMDWIDSGFATLSGAIENALPDGYLARLVTEGIVPGIGGVVIFVPQIAILFFMFSVLEESGYMPRIVYLMDRLMQKFGMSGKSIVPLISGFACAVPALMSARTIENKKERLITILVTPLLTCSARIPVYVVIIAVVVPDEMIGIFNARGIAMMALYLAGTLMAMLAAWVFNKILKNEFKSYLILEMPEYLMPGLKDVLITVWNSVKAFLWNAGKIIVATSIILFVLATNGLNDFNTAEDFVTENYTNLSDDEKETLTAARQLETSFLGMIGKAIEPGIAPLGYDWKIGIAIISSLSAREVFVGTISTIYSIGSDEELKVTERLKLEKNQASGLPIFTLATCISLLAFYAFSLQCFSTIAVTYKETRSLKWTLIQFFYMTALAYLVAFIAYQTLA